MRTTFVVTRGQNADGSDLQIEMCVTFRVLDGERRTWDYPGSPDEIEIEIESVVPESLTDDELVALKAACWEAAAEDRR